MSDQRDTMTPAEMNNKKLFCTDCKHFKEQKVFLKACMVYPEACLHPRNESLIDGSPFHSPNILRYSKDYCGPDGRWFEEREISETLSPTTPAKPQT